jgi:hypothetical protein
MNVKPSTTPFDLSLPDWGPFADVVDSILLTNTYVFFSLKRSPGPHGGSRGFSKTLILYTWK